MKMSRMDKLYRIKRHIYYMGVCLESVKHRKYIHDSIRRHMHSIDALVSAEEEDERD